MLGRRLVLVGEEGLEERARRGRRRGRGGGEQRHPIAGGGGHRRGARQFGRERRRALTARRLPVVRRVLSVRVRPVGTTLPGPLLGFGRGLGLALLARRGLLGRRLGGALVAARLLGVQPSGDLGLSRLLATLLA